MVVVAAARRDEVVGGAKATDEGRAPSRRCPDRATGKATPGVYPVLR